MRIPRINPITNPITIPTTRDFDSISFTIFLLYKSVENTWGFKRLPLAVSGYCRTEVEEPLVC